MWENSAKAIRDHLFLKISNGLFLTRVDMHTGNETRSYYGALDAFYAGMLALSGDLKQAAANQQANYYLWTRFNMEPEVYNFMYDTIVWPSYPLRPENLESCFYLWRLTKDEKYLYMGKRMIDDILMKCRTEAGFAHIRDVNTLEKEDAMESFFLAETLKYAYLLFAPESVLDLNTYVFNTEAHPLKKR
jgi:mannosidase alpha-like ER degradation enhancer 2